MMTLNDVPYNAILPEHLLHTLAESWLMEDSSSGFDAGAAAVGKTSAQAVLYQKSDGVVAGRPFFDAVMHAVGCEVTWKVKEGAVHEGVSGRVELATVTGPCASLLRGERVALNALAECSGVATAARRASELAQNWTGRVAMTRKTTPGFRAVQKYGVILGGMDPHRYALSGMCMLKDNHIMACGGDVELAVKRARAVGGFSVKVEVECGCVEEALHAGKAGADVVMLDNMNPVQFDTVAKKVKEEYPNIIVEGSGGLNFDTLKSYMSPYADVLSFSVNRYATPVDMSLKVKHSPAD